MSKTDDSAISDPENYRRLREPFESVEEFNEACEKFFNGWKALRDECGLPDVLVSIAAPIQLEGLATEMMSVQEAGDSFRAVALAAFAYGKIRDNHEWMIDQLLGQQVTKKKKKTALFETD